MTSFGTQTSFTESTDMDLLPARRPSDNTTKGVTLDVASEPARKSIDRSQTIHHPQHQPTIFGIEPEPHERIKAKRNSSNFSLEHNKARNIVIFGDSGVGKSSLINMLAGRKTAATSHGVLGCTFESRQYSIIINGEKINVWDTAGLDEGTRGRVPPHIAEKSLTKLLRELRNANGIHLLVYCIRGPSVRKSLARNYTIFYSAICRKKVPIVAVVTGLENEPSSMDDWWTRGEKELAKYKMRFDAHACITTMDMDKAVGSVFEERSLVSQKLARKLIIDYCHRVTTRPSDTNLFIKAALLDFRSMMKSGWEHVQPISTVVFCQSDIPLFRSGVFGDLRRISSHINGRTFVFHHAGDLSERYITPRMSKGGADLLIFAGTMSRINVERLRQFYASCTGEVCPVLVVTEDTFVDAWTERLNTLGIGARVEPLPTDGHQGFLNLIDELCLVRGPAKYRRGNLLKLFGRKAKENGDDITAPHDDGVLLEIGKR